MKLSNYFLPTLKETPREAEVVSHQLMLRAGMIHKNAAGIYNWLPFATNMLEKIKQVIREEMAKSGANEILMSLLQPKSLWDESGRYDGYGKEMLRMKDRHENDMLFSPTAEEVVCDIFRSYIKSYKDLPINLYQMHWKFRDEIRPRFGVLRGREFLMKDGYSFDLDEENAIKSYNLMFITYLKIFKRLGCVVIPTRADNGVIGGDLSHEFHVVAGTGESDIYYDRQFETLDVENINIDDVEKIKSIYSAADEKYDQNNCPVSEKDLIKTKAIEVGHIFNFGTKYSESMKFYVNDKEGRLVPPNMGSYGIGISRLIAAIIEASHDDKGLILPLSIAPFKVIIINLRVGDTECDKVSEDIYNKLINKNIEVLYDDTDKNTGQKFANADLIGIPYQLVIGPRLIKENKVEVITRKTNEKQEISIDNVVNLF